MKQARMLLLFSILLAESVTGQQQSSSFRSIKLVFHHMVGKDSLVLGNECINALGDTISIYRLKYYLSNFAVTAKGGQTVSLKQEYYLVDESAPETKTIALSVPAGLDITGISFLLGVDSIKNVSGIQAGALDPAKGMFWTWNSGYIMAKLEGSSPAAHVAGNIFTYHIGGYRSPFKTMKQIVLPVTNDRSQIDIVADINHWFKGPSEIHIAEAPVCHSPGTLAARIADNYSGMFSIKQLP